MGYFENLVSIPATFYKLKKNVNVQKTLIKNTLLHDLEALKKNDGSLNAHDLKKITHYYALGVPAILGTAFSLLRRQALSYDERMALTYLGALTGLGDDFFDDKHLNENELNILLQILISDNKTELYHPKTDAQKLFVMFFNKALQHTTHKELLRFYVKEVFKAQIASKKQTISSINTDEIFKITCEKGGNSLLFYRSVLYAQADNFEAELLYNLGALMQLGNDIFDVYKDYNDGIKTLATTSTNIFLLKTSFIQLFEKTINLAYKTNYQPKHIKAFLRFISMGLCRVFVCLALYQKNQNNSDGIFTVHKYNRKELICDMERPLNILKSITYYIKYDLKK